MIERMDDEIVDSDKLIKAGGVTIINNIDARGGGAGGDSNTRPLGACEPGPVIPMNT
jgi:hypothetical protein